MAVYKTDANKNLVKTAGNSGSGLPIGSIFSSAIPQTDARVHLLDGSTILQTGVYKTFANLIKALVSAGNNISCTQSQFDSDVSVYGQCGKFVIDDTAGTIKLPLITEFIASNNGGQNIGLAQLDDFKRHNHGITVASDGSIVSYNMTLSSSGVNTTYRFSSTGNVGNRNGADGSHYTGGSETRPKNVRYPYYIVLASGYKSDQVVDIDNIVTELNGKQDKLTAEESQVLLYGTAGATSGATSGTITLGDITPYKFLVFVSGYGGFKTINTYSVKSFVNGALGLYGYASQYINITISGSPTACKFTIDATGTQSLWTIWGVK